MTHHNSTAENFRLKPEATLQPEATLRVGLVGCGKMGLHHLAAIAKAPGAKVVGIADPLADAADLKASFRPTLASSPTWQRC